MDTLHEVHCIRQGIKQDAQDSPLVKIRFERSLLPRLCFESLQPPGNCSTRATKIVYEDYQRIFVNMAFHPANDVIGRSALARAKPFGHLARRCGTALQLTIDVADAQV